MMPDWAAQNGGFNLTGVTVFTLGVFPLTIILTWVFNNTRGSVLMAILLHGTMDVFPNAFLLAHLPGAAETTSAGALSMYWGLALGFGLFALLLVVFTRGRLGKRHCGSSPSMNTVPR